MERQESTGRDRVGGQRQGAQSKGRCGVSGLGVAQRALERQETMTSRTDELRTLIEETEASGGSVTAELIVERAKNAERWPQLNAHFWQVPESDLAHEARIARAHRLLITLTVTVRESGEVTRMMIHTPGERGYQSLPAISRKPDLARVKLQQLIEDISRARARLRAFRAAIPDDVADEIDTALEVAETTANRAETARSGPVEYGMAGIGMQE